MSSAQRQLTVVVSGQSYLLSGENVIEVLRRPRVTRGISPDQPAIGAPRRQRVSSDDARRATVTPPRG